MKFQQSMHNFFMSSQCLKQWFGIELITWVFNEYDNLISQSEK